MPEYSKDLRQVFICRGKSQMTRDLIVSQPKQNKHLSHSKQWKGEGGG